MHCRAHSIRYYFKMFGFQIFRFWAYLMKVIPEKRHAHLIWYLHFYVFIVKYIYFNTVKLFRTYNGCVPILPNLEIPGKEYIGDSGNCFFRRTN
jgi:hypothetical protein